MADDIRSELSYIRNETQKSVKGSMSVVELTIAIHHVFSAPMDKILWDAGDQVRLCFMLIVINVLIWLYFNSTREGGRVKLAESFLNPTFIAYNILDRFIQRFDTLQ